MKRTSDPLGPLTPVEFHVLLSLSAGGLHGYAILQDVAQRTRQITLRTGTLYTVIKRMLDGRWIEETATGGALLTIGIVRWRVAKERVRAGHALLWSTWPGHDAGSIVNAYAYKVKVSRFRRF